MKKSSRELRKFGITMAIACIVVGAILFFRDKSAWIYLAYISGFFLISGLLVPRILLPIEWVWMKIAFVLGIIVTNILLTLTFFLVITPIGLMMRLFGKDFLSLRFDKNTGTYWIPVEPDGTASRPEKPY